MGRDTLVQEFKGRKDHVDYIKRGIKVENEFIQTAKSHGYTVAIADEQENINKHIDLYLTYKGLTVSVDVKARRTGNKNKFFDDAWIVVEFLNTMGNKGWLYGDCDYFVFEREHDYVWCDAKELVELTDKVVDKNTRVKSYSDAEYKTWGRIHQGKQDLISRIEMSLILNLNKTFIMEKSLDIVSEVCHNSVINKNERKIHMSVLKGNAYWASIVSPNTTFDSDGVWSIDVGNLDKKNTDVAKADGLSVKNKGDDRGDFVTVKRKVRRKDGNMNKAPEVVDAGKRNMSGTLIGNGSEVNVLYSTYDWEFKGRSGTSADLRAVQVTNLVPYNVDADADEAFEVVPDGFVTEDSDEELSFAS
tara:strand:+ start:1404 stop:2483 length:1080 start_codon:yes stop_codon:yes gene_type:complete